jgi:thymidylate kinase
MTETRPVTAARPGQWHPVLAAVFAAFDAHRIRWCLLRVPSHPQGPTGDVDLLVHDADSATVRAVLQDLGFARQPIGGTPDLFFLRYHGDTDCWLWLHITRNLAFGPYGAFDTGAAAACLDRRMRHRDAWLLNDADTFWVTLLHGLLDKGTVSVGHRGTLSAFTDAAAAGGPVADVVARYCPPGWTISQLLGCAHAGEWDALANFGSALPAQWRFQAPGAMRAARAAHLARLLRHPLNPWRRRGLSVAVVGPDGAGKSTLAAGVADSFFLPTVTSYMEVRDESLAGVARWRVPGLTFLVYLIVLWRRLAAARYHQAHGELVVFDRYTSDVLVASADGLDCKKRLARWIHRYVFPDVDLALVLDVPGSVMFARKGERSPEELEAERQRLLRLSSVRSNIDVLDGTQSADQVRRAAIERIWSRYADRWRGRGPSNVTASTAADW